MSMENFIVEDMLNPTLPNRNMIVCMPLSPPPSAHKSSCSSASIGNSFACPSSSAFTYDAVVTSKDSVPFESSYFPTLKEREGRRGGGGGGVGADEEGGVRIEGRRGVGRKGRGEVGIEGRGGVGVERRGGGMWFRMTRMWERKMNLPDVSIYFGSYGNIVARLSPAAVLKEWELLTKDLKAVEREYFYNKAEHQVQVFLQKGENFLAGLLVGDVSHFSADVCFHVENPFRLLIPFDYNVKESQGILIDYGQLCVDSSILLPRVVSCDAMTPPWKLYDRYAIISEGFSISRVQNAENTLAALLSVSHAVSTKIVVEDRNKMVEGDIGIPDVKWMDSAIWPKLNNCNHTSDPVNFCMSTMTAGNIVHPLTCRGCLDVCHLSQNERFPALRLLLHDATDGGVVVDLFDNDIVQIMTLVEELWTNPLPPMSHMEGCFTESEAEASRGKKLATPLSVSSSSLLSVKRSNASLMSPTIVSSPTARVLDKEAPFRTTCSRNITALSAALPYAPSVNLPDSSTTELPSQIPMPRDLESVLLSHLICSNVHSKNNERRQDFVAAMETPVAVETLPPPDHFANSSSHHLPHHHHHGQSVLISESPSVGISTYLTQSYKQFLSRTSSLVREKMLVSLPEEVPTSPQNLSVVSRAASSKKQSSHPLPARVKSSSCKTTTPVMTSFGGTSSASSSIAFSSDSVLPQSEPSSSSTERQTNSSSSPSACSSLPSPHLFRPAATTLRTCVTTHPSETSSDATTQGVESSMSYADHHTKISTASKIAKSLVGIYFRFALPRLRIRFWKSRTLYSNNDRSSSSDGKKEMIVEEESENYNKYADLDVEIIQSRASIGTKQNTRICDICLAVRSLTIVTPTASSAASSSSKGSSYSNGLQHPGSMSSASATSLFNSDMRSSYFLSSLSSVADSAKGPPFTPLPFRESSHIFPPVRHSRHHTTFSDDVLKNFSRVVFLYDSVDSSSLTCPSLPVNLSGKKEVLDCTECFPPPLCFETLWSCGVRRKRREAKFSNSSSTTNAGEAGGWGGEEGNEKEEGLNIMKRGCSQRKYRRRNSSDSLGEGENGKEVNKIQGCSDALDDLQKDHLEVELTFCFTDFRQTTNVTLRHPRVIVDWERLVALYEWCCLVHASIPSQLTTVTQPSFKTTASQNYVSQPIEQSHSSCTYTGQPTESATPLDLWSTMCSCDTAEESDVSPLIKWKSVAHGTIIFFEVWLPCVTSSPVDVSARIHSQEPVSKFFSPTELLHETLFHNHSNRTVRAPHAAKTILTPADIFNSRRKSEDDDGAGNGGGVDQVRDKEIIESDEGRNLKKLRGSILSSTELRTTTHATPPRENCTTVGGGATTIPAPSTTTPTAGTTTASTTTASSDTPTISITTPTVSTTPAITPSSNTARAISPKLHFRRLSDSMIRNKNNSSGYVVSSLPPLFAFRFSCFLNISNEMTANGITTHYPSSHRQSRSHEKSQQSSLPDGLTSSGGRIDDEGDNNNNDDQKLGFQLQHENESNGLGLEFSSSKKNEGEEKKHDSSSFHLIDTLNNNRLKKSSTSNHHHCPSLLPTTTIDATTTTTGTFASSSIFSLRTTTGSSAATSPPPPPRVLSTAWSILENYQLSIRWSICNLTAGFMVPTVTEQQQEVSSEMLRWLKRMEGYVGKKSAVPDRYKNHEIEDTIIDTTHDNMHYDNNSRKRLSSSSNHHPIASHSVPISSGLSASVEKSSNDYSPASCLSSSSYVPKPTASTTPMQAALCAVTTSDKVDFSSAIITTFKLTIDWGSSNPRNATIAPFRTYGRIQHCESFLVSAGEDCCCRERSNEMTRDKNFIRPLNQSKHLTLPPSITEEAAAATAVTRKRIGRPKLIVRSFADPLQLNFSSECLVYGYALISIISEAVQRISVSPSHTFMAEEDLWLSCRRMSKQPYDFQKSRSHQSRHGVDKQCVSFNINTKNEKLEEEEIIRIEDDEDETIPEEFVSATNADEGRRDSMLHTMDEWGRKIWKSLANLETNLKVHLTVETMVIEFVETLSSRRYSLAQIQFDDFDIEASKWIKQREETKIPSVFSDGRNGVPKVGLAFDLQPPSTGRVTLNFLISANVFNRSLVTFESFVEPWKWTVVLEQKQATDEQLSPFLTISFSWLNISLAPCLYDSALHYIDSVTECFRGLSHYCQRYQTADGRIPTTITRSHHHFTKSAAEIELLNFSLPSSSSAQLLQSVYDVNSLPIDRGPPHFSVSEILFALRANHGVNESPPTWNNLGVLSRLHSGCRDELNSYDPLSSYLLADPTSYLASSSKWIDFSAPKPRLWNFTGQPIAVRVVVGREDVSPPFSEERQGRIETTTTTCLRKEDYGTCDVLEVLNVKEENARRGVSFPGSGGGGVPKTECFIFQWKVVPPGANLPLPRDEEAVTFPLLVRLQLLDHMFELSNFTLNSVNIEVRNLPLTICEFQKHSKTVRPKIFEARVRLLIRTVLEASQMFDLYLSSLYNVRNFASKALKILAHPKVVQCAPPVPPLPYIFSSNTLRNSICSTSSISSDVSEISRIADEFTFPVENAIDPSSKVVSRSSAEPVITRCSSACSNTLSSSATSSYGFAPLELPANGGEAHIPLFWILPKLFVYHNIRRCEEVASDSASPAAATLVVPSMSFTSRKKPSNVSNVDDGGQCSSSNNRKNNTLSSRGVADVRSSSNLSTSWNENSQGREQQCGGVGWGDELSSTLKNGGGGEKVIGSHHRLSHLLSGNTVVEGRNRFMMTSANYGNQVSGGLNDSGGAWSMSMHVEQLFVVPSQLLDSEINEHEKSMNGEMDRQYPPIHQEQTTQQTGGEKTERFRNHTTFPHKNKTGTLLGYDFLWKMAQRIGCKELLPKDSFRRLMSTVSHSVHSHTIKSHIFEFSFDLTRPARCNAPHSTIASANSKPSTRLSRAAASRGFGTSATAPTGGGVQKTALAVTVYGKSRNLSSEVDPLFFDICIEAPLQIGNRLFDNIRLFVAGSPPTSAVSFYSTLSSSGSATASLPFSDNSSGPRLVWDLQAGEEVRLEESPKNIVIEFAVNLKDQFQHIYRSRPIAIDFGTPPSSSMLDSPVRLHRVMIWDSKTDRCFVEDSKAHNPLFDFEPNDLMIAAEIVPGPSHMSELYSTVSKDSIGSDAAISCGLLSELQKHTWETCVRSIKLFAPYWIVNRHQTALRIGSSKQSQRVGEIERRVLSSNLAPKVRVGWATDLCKAMSNQFRVDAVQEAGQLVVIPKTSMGPAHWLGVNVSLAPPPFIRTKIVNIYARFNLVNDLPYDLWFVECGGKNWVKLVTQCRIAFDPQNVGLRGKPSLQISLVDPSTIPIRSTTVQKKKIVTSWSNSLDSCSGIISEFDHEKDKNNTVAPLPLSVERERRRKRRPTNKRNFAEESTKVVMEKEEENDLQSIKNERRIEKKENDEIVSRNKGSPKGIGHSASTVLANISSKIPTHSKLGRGNSYLKYLSCEFSISDLGTFQLRHASSTSTRSGGKEIAFFSTWEGENVGRPPCLFVITQVDIRAVESASIFVRFSIPEKADFLLCNDASRQIHFSQVGLRHASKEILNAGEKCQYTWHDISGVRKLRFTVKDDRRRQISFNCAIARVKTHTKVVLGHHRLLYVVTGVEKDRRVVYISEDKKRFDLMRRNELPYRRLKGFRDLHHELINIRNRFKVKKKKAPPRRMQATIGASRSQHKKPSAKNIQSPMMTTTALDKTLGTTTSSVSSSNKSAINSEKRRRHRRRRRRLTSSLTKFKKGGITDAVAATGGESETVVKESCQISSFSPPFSSVSSMESESDFSQSLATDNSPQSTSSCSPGKTTTTSITIDRKERCTQEDNPQKRNTQSLLFSTTTTSPSKQVNGFSNPFDSIDGRSSSTIVNNFGNPFDSIDGRSSSTIVNNFGNPFSSMDNPSSQCNRDIFLITPAAQENSRMLAVPCSESEISQTSTEWNNDDSHNEESDENMTTSLSPRRTKEKEQHVSFRLNGKEHHNNDQGEKGKVMILTSSSRRRSRRTPVVCLHPESSKTKRRTTAAAYPPCLSPTRSQSISSSRKKKEKMKTRRRLSPVHFETRPRIFRYPRVHKHSVASHELPVSSYNSLSATTRRQMHHDVSPSPLHDTLTVVNTTRGSHFQNIGFRVEVFLSGCGVSLVNNLPSEVIYISISKVVIATRSSVGSSHTDFKLQIQNFQIDNRCAGAHSTTIVRPSTEEDFKRHGSSGKSVKPSAIPWKQQKPSSYNSSRSVHTDVTPGERDVYKSPVQNAFKQLQPFLDWDCEEEEGEKIDKEEDGEKIDIRGQCCSSPPLVQLNLGGVLGAEAAVLRYVVCELRPLTIHIEVDTAFELADYFLHFLQRRSLYFRSLHTENIMFIRQSQRDPLSEGFRRLRDAPMPPPPAPPALRYSVYIQTFIIDGTKFLVSARAPRIHRHLGINRDAVMLRHFKFVGARLTTDVTNFPITFKCLIQQSLFTNPDQLLGELLNWYLQQTIRQIGKLVGSIDLLGNPLGFMSRVSEGLMELFRDPYEGMLKGPEAFLGGLGKGVRVFIVSILTGILDSLSQFTGSLFKVFEWGRACDGWELLGMWPEAIRADRVAIEQPDNVLDGFWRGAQGGLQIQGAALASIVMRPLQQYRHTGCLGLFWGFVVGIPTAVFGFIGGFLIFGQALFAGIRSSLTRTYQAESVRPPRVFGPNRIVSQYSPYDGLASELLFKYLKHDASSLPVVASFPLRWSPGSRRSLRKWQLRLQQRLRGVTPSPYERFFLHSSDYIIITPQLFIYFREGAMIWACRHQDVLQIEVTVRLSPPAAEGKGDHQRDLLPQKSERERECIIFELLHGVAVTSYNRILGATEPTLRLRVRNSMGQSYEFYRKRAPQYCKLCLQQQATSEGIMGPLNHRQTKVGRVILTNTIGSYQSPNTRNIDGITSSKIEMDSTAGVSNLAYLEKKKIFSEGPSKHSTMILPKKSKFNWISLRGIGRCRRRSMPPPFSISCGTTSHLPDDEVLRYSQKQNSVSLDLGRSSSALRPILSSCLREGQLPTMTGTSGIADVNKIEDCSSSSSLTIPFSSSFSFTSTQLLTTHDDSSTPFQDDSTAAIVVTTSSNEKTMGLDLNMPKKVDTLSSEAMIPKRGSQVNGDETIYQRHRHSTMITIPPTCQYRPHASSDSPKSKDVSNAKAVCHSQGGIDRKDEKKEEKKRKRRGNWLLATYRHKQKNEAKNREDKRHKKEESLSRSRGSWWSCRRENLFLLNATKKGRRPEDVKMPHVSSELQNLGSVPEHSLLLHNTTATTTTTQRFSSSAERLPLLPSLLTCPADTLSSTTSSSSSFLSSSNGFSHEFLEEKALKKETLSQQQQQQQQSSPKKSSSSSSQSCCCLSHRKTIPHPSILTYILPVADWATAIRVFDVLSQFVVGGQVMMQREGARTEGCGGEGCEEGIGEKEE